MQACVHSSTKFYRALSADPASFVWGILDHKTNWTCLRESERYHVALFDSHRNGYNSTPGGEGCRMEPVTYIDVDGVAIKRYPLSTKGQNEGQDIKAGIAEGASNIPSVALAEYRAGRVFINREQYRQRKVRREEKRKAKRKAS